MSVNGPSKQVSEADHLSGVENGNEGKSNTPARRGLRALVVAGLALAAAGSGRAVVKGAYKGARRTTMSSSQVSRLKKSVVAFAGETLTNVALSATDDSTDAVSDFRRIALKPERFQGLGLVSSHLIQQGRNAPEWQREWIMRLWGTEHGEEEGAQSEDQAAEMQLSNSSLNRALRRAAATCADRNCKKEDLALAFVCSTLFLEGDAVALGAITALKTMHDKRDDIGRAALDFLEARVSGRTAEDALAAANPTVAPEELKWWCSKLQSAVRR